MKYVSDQIHEEAPNMDGRTAGQPGIISGLCQNRKSLKMSAIHRVAIACASDVPVRTCGQHTSGSRIPRQCHPGGHGYIHPALRCRVAEINHYDLHRGQHLLLGEGGRAGLPIAETAVQT